jgi:uncharacterized membrane protein YjfL (UPF0719 family)
MAKAGTSVRGVSASSVASSAVIGRGRSLEVDNIRLLATLLLVSYHVIGSAPNVGLQVEATSAYRHFAEYFVAVRMPLFGFVAGVVYAIRPPRLEDFSRFAMGKVHRLLVPGAVAVSVYLAISGALLGQPLDARALAAAFGLPYLHFWFLQAIFVILLVFGAFDMLTRHRAELLIAPVVVAGYFLADGVMPQAFSLHMATYLLPFFVLGVIAYRRREALAERREALLAIGSLVLAGLTAVFLADLAADGVAAIERRSAFALAFGATASIWLLLALPQVPAARAFGAFGLTIYLYHVLATSAARRVLDAAGIDDRLTHLAVGVTAGLLAPIALHMACERFALTRRLVLGTGPSRAAGPRGAVQRA